MNTALSHYDRLAPAATAVEVARSRVERAEEVLTPEALGLLMSLHQQFDQRRLELLAARQQRQLEFAAGELPDFLPASADVRTADWRVAPVPGDLIDRRVEITGPVDRKMVINALNAPVRTFMADFEDSCSPTWDNLLRGQVNLADAIRRRISYTDSAGKLYRLNPRTATLIVRPRGWHLPEKHVRIGGEPVSGALFDFALYLAVNYEALARSGTGPYFYLPKLESHLEARLWNDVFVAAQDHLGIPRGTIKATVLIETILAAFEMDEILFDLEPPRSAPVERRLRRCTGSSGYSPRHHQGHGADRDHSGGFRDGRDSVRAARAFGWTELRALGLHLQFHQEVPQPE